MAEVPWDAIIAEAGDRYNQAPPGEEYDFVIASAETKKFPTGEGIKVKLKVSNGPHAGKSVKAVNMIKAPKTAGMFLDHLAAVGITPTVIREQRPTLAQIAAVLPGKQVRGKTKLGTWQGRTETEIEWAMKAPSGGAVAVTEFPVLTAADELGYSDNSGSPVMAIADDAGF